MGRKLSKKNNPRTCDIDILDYDKKLFKKNVNKHKLIIPHPRLHDRNFVLIPLYEIENNWTHPKLKLKIINL